MNGLHLHVEAQAYELRLDGAVLARLAGGAAALLPVREGRLRELDIETAIERSEDWLMPFSAAMRGHSLRVHDGTGRIATHLRAAAGVTPDEVEDAFTRAFDDVAFDRPIDREWVADIVLLRELVHHGRLVRVIVDEG